MPTDYRPTVFLPNTEFPMRGGLPLLEPKPVFVPGMYETEARNSAFKDHPVTIADTKAAPVAPGTAINCRRTR
jgi:hypothetical protein